MKPVFRWMLVLPAAIAANVAVHLSLYRFGEESLFAGTPIIGLFTLFLANAAPVYVGSMVAPQYKFISAVIVSLLFLLWYGSQITNFSVYMMVPLLAIIAGMTLSCVVAWQADKLLKG